MSYSLGARRDRSRASWRLTTLHYQCNRLEGCRHGRNASMSGYLFSSGYRRDRSGKCPDRRKIRRPSGDSSHLGARSAQISHVTVGNRSHDMEISFSPDILSILTTKGCNGSGCHGSPAGQNGFKLSLFGYDAEADYQMIVKTHEGRRVNLQESGGKPHSPETFFCHSSRRRTSSSATIPKSIESS